MDYPLEFVQRVKAEYPKNFELHALLEAGSLNVTEHLKVKLASYDPYRILGIFRSLGMRLGLDELNRQCSEYVRRMELYYEWQRKYLLK